MILLVKLKDTLTQIFDDSSARESLQPIIDFLPHLCLCLFTILKKNTKYEMGEITQYNRI